MLPYIGIDECYGAPGCGDFEVHVAIAALSQDEIIKKNLNAYSKQGRSRYTSDEILCLLGARPFSYVLIPRRKNDPDETKQIVYPFLIKSFEMRNLTVLVDGYLSVLLRKKISENVQKEIIITKIIKGDQRVRILNLADLVAYHLSEIHRGKDCGIFNNNRINVEI